MARISQRRMVWAVEVKYTPNGDGRLRPWMRSDPMTYTDAKQEVIEYQRMGHRAKIVRTDDDEQVTAA